MKTLFEPGQQTRLGAGQVDACHADLGESEFPAPGLYRGNQLTAIDDRADALHSAIVKTLVWHDESQTQRFATALAAVPALRHCFIALHGELGAGKTTLVRHLLRALGVTSPIKSPTYALVETYEIPAPPTRSPDRAAAWPVSHFDFYRFADPQEWEDAGFRDLFAGPGLKISEWPDKAAGLLPQADLAVFIQVEPDARRRVRLEAGTAIGAALLTGVAGC